MREGPTKLLIIITGPPGVGKTGIRHLLLSLPPPPSMTSTPLATRATRAISFYHIKANGSVDVTCMELDDDTYITEEVKMIELNPSRAVPPQPATSTTPAATESSVQEPSDVDDTPPVLSPATPLVSSSSPAESVEDTTLPPSSKVEGIALEIVDKLVRNPELSNDSKKVNKTFVHLIDSGGQPSFISLVPAFVRGSTVNIVASKLNHSINNKLQHKYVKDDKHLRKATKLDKSQLESMQELIHILSSVKHSMERCRILSSVKHSMERCSQGSKFLLIGTHADKHWSFFQESIAKKNESLKESLGDLKSMCIEVSPDGDILLSINARVTKGHSDMGSFIRQKIMQACVFELEVSKTKKEGRSILDRVECIEVHVGRNLNMREEDVMVALVFLDGAALCLYFPAAAPHLVFTDSQAVTEILNLGVIDFHIIPSRHPLSEHMALVRRVRDQVLFNKKLVDIVCSKYRVNEEGKCSYSVDDFRSILQHLLIIAPVCIDGEEQFFIPCILPTCKKISPLAGRKLAPLVLLCRTRVIPLGMFSALVVALLFNEQLFALHKILGHKALSLKCKLGGVVQIVECHAWLAVHFNGHPSVAPRIRAAIHHAIDTVCRQRHLDTKQIVFTDGFFCPFKNCESISHAFVANTVTHWLTCSVRPDIGCGPCSDERMLAWLAAPDASTISASSATATPQSHPLTVSVSTSVTAQSPSITLPSPPMGTDTVSRFQFMEAVTSKIPSMWERVGASLGIDQSLLDAIDMHRKGNPLKRFGDVFTYWQQQSSPQSPANWATRDALLKSNYVGEEELSDTIENTYNYYLQYIM